MKIKKINKPEGRLRMKMGDSIILVYFTTRPRVISEWTVE